MSAFQQNLIWISTLLLTIAFSTLPTKSAAEIKVLDKYLYAEFTLNGETGSRFKTDRIPNLPDKACFGWVVKVTPSDKLFKITEIFTLPGAPKEWGGVDQNTYSPTKTSADGKIATTARFMSLKSGVLENSWCLSNGDESGMHHIVVLNGQQVLAEFEFEVYDR